MHLKTHKNIDFYLDELNGEIDYTITTNKNTIILRIVGYDNLSSIFDELLIFDENGNNKIVQRKINKYHASNDIMELILFYLL